MTGGTGGSALGGSATGGSKLDGGIADTLDASVRTDGPSADMPSYGDFNVLIAGTWLVGWRSGDARNYSWVRLGGKMYGTAEYLSGADLPSNTPLWACDGQDSWDTTAAPYAIMLDFPSSCPSGLPRYFTFRSPPDTTVAPPGATFGMVSPTTSSPRTIEWWRYPDDQCDATMSTCKNPF